jgi:protoporphyrin/coproporphyrin ferrochelatase
VYNGSLVSTFVLANFGGPRCLEEIPIFLKALLTDIDVIRTPFPRFLEKWFFKKLAHKRALKVKAEYELLGGKSPIFEDTENLANILRKCLDGPVITFHRYLPQTHANFVCQMEKESSEKIVVLPLYPQFSFSTTGSIARFFAENLQKKTVDKLRWIKSYAANERYIWLMQKNIKNFLEENGLEEKNVVLFFSAHGLPQRFVEKGDPYEKECYLSFNAIKVAFPLAHCLLAFQSQFGPGEWLRPYTNELCATPLKWNLGRQNVVIIPLSFTSDHIETLVEIEHQYLPLIRKVGLNGYRCPALNRRKEWGDVLLEIMKTSNRFANLALIRG